MGFSEIKQLIFNEMGISEEKTRDICLNGGFLMRKRVIIAKVGDFREENSQFLLKWQISEEKTHDFHLNGGFSKRKRVIFA